MSAFVLLTSRYRFHQISAIFIIVGLSLVTQFLGEIQEVIIRWRYGVIEPDDSKFRVETLKDVRERIHWRNMAVQERVVRPRPAYSVTS